MLKDNGTFVRGSIWALIGMAMLLPQFGCRSEPTIAGDATFPTRATYNIAPKILYDRVKAAIVAPPINLKVDSEGDGRILTDWQDAAGARVTVAGLGRTWQERTRYTITISPAWDDPAKSTIEVTEESQQRPHDKHDWGSDDPIKRPARAAVLARQIDDALRAAATQ